MKLSALFILSTAVLFLGSSFVIKQDRSQNQIEKLAQAASFVEPVSDKVQWLSFEEAVAALEKEPRKIMVDVYTDWCGWCKRMDANTFSHDVVSKYLNDKWYAVKLDAEQKESIMFQGKEFKFVASGRRGYNELAAQLLEGRMSYPSIVYLDEEANRIQSIPGYKDAYQQDKILKFFGENAFQNQTWTEFQQNYKSPLRGGNSE
jgi:thioredoxin-related protein